MTDLPIIRKKRHGFNMTTINSFLQRIKLQEIGRGIYMVFAAYVLSFLLLIIGSDTLYNIKSKADGMSSQSDEVEQKVTAPVDNSLANKASKSLQVKSNIEYMQEQPIPTADDTNWLLGYAMNDEEYNRLMLLMDENEVLAEGDEKVISGFSVSEAPTKESSKSNNKASFTKDEIKMLERIVEAEATGEGIKGKILIANVIFNRIEDEEFPDNVKDVIFQKVGDDYQFSPISDKRYWNVKITEETREAVQRAIDGEDYSEGALYFMARKLARKSSTKWFDNNLEWLFKHGGHEFFK